MISLTLPCTWSFINPFLSQEPAFRAGGMLSSPGGVQSPPSQPLLCHSPPSPQRLLDSPLVNFISNLNQVHTTETPLNPGFDVSIGKLWWPALLRLGSAKGIFHLVSSNVLAPLCKTLSIPPSGSCHLSDTSLQERCDESDLAHLSGKVSSRMCSQLLDLI